MNTALSENKVIDQFKKNDVIFMPGSSAEPTTLINAIAQRGDALPPLHIINSFVSGVNKLALATPDNNISETVFFPKLHNQFTNIQDNRIKFIPLSYYDVSHYLAQQNFDWVVIHVSPPNSRGECSLGLSVEFIPTVARKSKRMVALINQQMPCIKGSPTINIKTFDAIIETDTPLVTYDVGGLDPVSSKIAAHIKTLITAESVLQVGLGKIPEKLLSSLGDLKNLKFHSGILSNGFFNLAKQGALDPNFQHTTCCALGSSEFYKALPLVENFSIQGVELTHKPASFNNYDSVTSINSALEVDLFGQANLEILSKRQISSVGGAADFSRAARCSANGKSIIALPSTTSDGKKSRIVPVLSGPVVSLSRTEIDYIVTEFGIAELSHKPIAERLSAIVSIAAPEFREALCKHLAL